MIFSDGECPSCDAAQLHLNTSDFFECPQCHLVCACIDGLIATVMPWRGEGNFRFEDCDIAPFRGVAFAKSKSMTVIPDVESIFYSRDAISNYIGPSDKQDFTEGENLSPSFLFAFRDFILNCSIEELQLAWSSKTARTRFYTERVMPAVAKKLGLLHGKEEFKVDFVMTKESFRGHSIPKIYIESENNYEDASHEIRKLCLINSPLRYLITVTNKKSQSDTDSPIHQQLREWQSIIKSHHETNPDFRGIIGVIIGSKIIHSLEFLACAFRPTGDLVRPLSKLLSRDIM